MESPFFLIRNSRVQTFKYCLSSFQGDFKTHFNFEDKVENIDEIEKLRKANFTAQCNVAACLLCLNAYSDYFLQYESKGNEA